jgi:hypothetical protein
MLFLPSSLAASQILFLFWGNYNVHEWHFPFLSIMDTFPHLPNSELFIYLFIYFYSGACGGAVVEALRYKPEGRGIDSRWCHWNFSLT